MMVDLLEEANAKRWFTFPAEAGQQVHAEEALRQVMGEVLEDPGRAGHSTFKGSFVSADVRP